MSRKTVTISYEALGEGRYRVCGPRFLAEVHMYHRDGRWVCVVDSCNNIEINAADVMLWCEEHIGGARRLA